MQNADDRFGSHRVVKPKGVLPQQAEVVVADTPIFLTEMLVEVESLNIDSASFHQIRKSCGDDVSKMAKVIEEIVNTRGKMQNPVTGSGGMFIGTVKEIGSKFLEGKVASEIVKVGDRIASLVSLTLTPLKIKKIKKIHLDLDRVDIEGHAILFQSGIYSLLPKDISDTLALAVLDVCGAPAQTKAMCKEGNTVVLIGGAGKSGILSLYEAKKAVGKKGKVIALDYNAESVALLKGLSFVDEAHACDARNAMEVYELVKKITHGAMADVVINVTNIPDTEMSCILSAKHGGVVYYFSMATSFTKAALGAEGVGAHVDLIIGNGYRPGHAALTLQILRDSKEIKEIYEKKYGSS